MCDYRPVTPQVVAVLELWAQLQRAGLPPTVLAFSHVVSAYSVARCDRMSLDLYRDLSARWSCVARSMCAHGVLSA